MINVYENENKYYLEGFDYNKVFQTNMGPDSKIHYYLVNLDDLKQKVSDENIVYHLMKESQKKMIADKYHTEVEERIIRIKKCSDLDLTEWRNQIVEDIASGYANSSLLVDIDKEISRRKALRGENDSLRKELIVPLKALAEELRKPNFDVSSIGDEIDALNSIYESFMTKTEKKTR